MMRGVSLTDGMRRFAARRRTVDSLTCKYAASCFAVRNSSRSFSSMVQLSSQRRKDSVLAPLRLCEESSLRLRRHRQRHTIDRSAVNLHVLRHRLCTVSFHTHAKLRRIRSEPEFKRTCLRGNSTIDLLGRSIFQDSEQLNFNVRHAATIRIENRSTEKRDRPLDNRQYQPVAERARLPCFDLNVLDRANTQPRLSKRQAINSRRKPRYNEIAVLLGLRARHLSLSASHDHRDAPGCAGFNPNFALNGAKRLILTDRNAGGEEYYYQHQVSFLESHRRSFTY